MKARWCLWLLVSLAVISCARPRDSEQSPKEAAASVQPNLPASATPADKNSPQAASSASDSSTKGGGELQTAVFSVPDVSPETIMKFIQVLAGREGLVSTQADRNNSLFKVSYLPGKISETEILELLRKVKPKVVLKVEGK